MRALVVEDRNEFVDAGLLLQEVGGCWLGGFFFQGEMHALVTAILLRMASLDALDGNTETKPPDSKFARVEQGVCRREGNAVVATDAGGQAALLEKPLKHRESVILSGRRKRFTGEQKTAGVIGDGEQIPILAIAQQELAFVIRTPEHFLRSAEDPAILRIPVAGGEAEIVIRLKGFPYTGTFGFWFGLDPTDAPLILRNVSTTEIYGLTLEE